MQILITGADGQVGKALQRTAPPAVRVIARGRNHLDITQTAAIRHCLAVHRPDQLINCAAYTAVDRAEAEPEQARALNAAAPARLARLCREHQCRLLHLSTDFVFDGTQGRPYRPDDAVNPLSVYGHSKAAGECAVRHASAGQALILRTAWVYAAEGRNFVTTMLRLLREREQLTVVSDQIGAPSRADNIARTLWALTTMPDACGTLHYTDAGVASWYDFAMAIRDEAGALGLLSQAATVMPIPTAAYHTPARRPHYSVLDTQATRQLTGLPAPHWRHALIDTLRTLR